MLADPAHAVERLAYAIFHRRAVDRRLSRGPADAWAREADRATQDELAAAIANVVHLWGVDEAVFDVASGAADQLDALARRVAPHAYREAS